MRRVMTVLAITIATITAAAHVAPSVDDNNRFLKLTPLGDRVRLAYTVLFGDNPGRGMRPGLDTDHDGIVGDAEAQAFGVKLAKDVADALDVDVDGKPYPVTWAEVAVGMGSPQVTGGTFSVDLIGFLCLPVARGAHHVQLRDHFRLTRPGETEVKVEDSPGVTIARARIGRADDPTYDYRFPGPGGPLADDGLDLRFDAGPRSVVAPDGLCAAPTAPESHALLIGVAVGVAIGLGVVGLLVLRRKRPA
jgi:hypothetical protein